MRLDIQAGNKKWQAAIDIEMGQIHEYETFIDKGKVVWEKGRPKGLTEEYKRIRCNFVFDVKHCGNIRQDLWLMGPGQKHLLRECIQE